MRLGDHLWVLLQVADILHRWLAHFDAATEHLVAVAHAGVLLSGCLLWTLAASTVLTHDVVVASGARNTVIGKVSHIRGRLD